METFKRKKGLGKEKSKTLGVNGGMKAYQKSLTMDSSAHTISIPSERESVCV